MVQRIPLDLCCYSGIQLAAPNHCIIPGCNCLSFVFSFSHTRMGQTNVRKTKGK